MITQVALPSILLMEVMGAVLATVAILALPEVAASMLFGMSDMFMGVGRDWPLVVEDRPGSSLLRVQIVSADGQPLTIANGVHLAPDTSIANAVAPQVICIPEVFVVPSTDLRGRYEAEAAWLREAHARGAIIAAACSGALLMADPTAIENPFYRLFPEAFVLPALVLATLAAIIASQAVISGAFSMTQQAIRLGYLPRMTVMHTSSKERGQVYVPFVNWALMIAVVGLVIGFQDSSNLASAYGIAVTGTFVITTCLITVVARRRWNWSLPLAAAMLIPLLVLELVFPVPVLVEPGCICQGFDREGPKL